MTAKRKTKRKTTATRSRNRKLQTQGFRMPMRSALIAVLLGAGGIFYLLLCSRTEALARQIKTEEHELEQLRRRVAGEEVRWNDMISPRNLQAALRANNLNMGLPRHDQVIHIRDMALWESGHGERTMVSRLDSNRGGMSVR